MLRSPASGHPARHLAGALASALRDPATVEGLRENLVIDGLFFAAMWTLVVLGIWLLWREGPRHAR